VGLDSPKVTKRIFCQRQHQCQYLRMVRFKPFSILANRSNCTAKQASAAIIVYPKTMQIGIHIRISTETQKKIKCQPTSSFVELCLFLEDNHD
jgi:hypothetical protein